MEKTNAFNLFKENRLAMRGGAEKPSGDPLEMISAGGLGESPEDVDRGREQANRAMAKQEREMMKQVKQREVVDATQKINKLVRKLDKDRRALQKIEQGSFDKNAQTVAVRMLLQTADSIGARKGTRAERIEESSDMSATLSAVTENLLYNEFRIDDQTDASQFDRIQDKLDSKKRGDVYDSYNKFAMLSNTVDRMKQEFA